MYDDGYDDGDDDCDSDDDCGHSLIPLSHYPSLISSSTHVFIVVLMNMLICYPLLQDQSDRWSACARRSMGYVASDTWRTTMRAILVPYMFASVKLTCTCFLMLSGPICSRFFKRIRWLRAAKSALFWCSWSILFLVATYYAKSNLAGWQTYAWPCWKSTSPILLSLLLFCWNPPHRGRFELVPEAW